jgi:hypothetical protein
MCNIFDDETCFVKMKPLPKEGRHFFEFLQGDFHMLIKFAVFLSPHMTLKIFRWEISDSRF